jgi:hypothetical protein
LVACGPVFDAEGRPFDREAADVAFDAVVFAWPACDAVDDDRAVEAGRSELEDLALTDFFAVGEARKVDGDRQAPLLRRPSRRRLGRPPWLAGGRPIGRIGADLVGDLAVLADLENVLVEVVPLRLGRQVDDGLVVDDDVGAGAVDGAGEQPAADDRRRLLLAGDAVGFGRGAAVG